MAGRVYLNATGRVFAPQITCTSSFLTLQIFFREIGKVAIRNYKIRLLLNRSKHVILGSSPRRNFLQTRVVRWAPLDALDRVVAELALCSRPQIRKTLPKAPRILDGLIVRLLVCDPRTGLLVGLVEVRLNHQPSPRDADWTVSLARETQTGPVVRGLLVWTIRSSEVRAKTVPSRLGSFPECDRRP
ncbi:hypothetical protein IWW34DRAFT_753714 [Fusarium oxysporum f. sp. albedinis]|nr:hypothetical protein IWW34DRAFT_753714 [Fusarium oxysporum f. sp. albedinis]